MNLTFVCKKFEEKEEKLIKDIIDLMGEKLNKEIKFNKKADIDNRYRADVFIIIDKEDINILEYFKSNKNIKNSNKIIVLLNKITEKNILNIVNYTKNICYINNDILIICRRIYKVYLDSCEIFEDK